MKRKKTFLLVSVCILLVLLSVCVYNISLKNIAEPLPSENEEAQQENVGSSNSCSIVDIEDFETLCQWSDTIVKAKYLSREKLNYFFDAAFSFELEEDFVGNVDEDEKILHVYESTESSFIEGKSYYLFMTSMHSPLYPYTVYRRVRPGFLMGEEGTGYTFYGSDLGVGDVSDMPAYIRTEIIEKGNYYEKKRETFEEACQNADAIYRIRLVEVEPNYYTSLCLYEVIETLRERYKKEEVSTEGLSEEVKEAAGVGVSEYPNVPGPLDAQVGEEYYYLTYYTENGYYVMYSEEHFLYSVDSAEGRYIERTARE